MNVDKPKFPVIIDQDDIHEEPEVFEDDDDGIYPPVLETKENSSPTFLAERISMLKIQSARNLAETRFCGLHPSYNIGVDKPENQLRGLVLHRNFSIAEYCVASGIFISYRQLFYYTLASMKKNKKYVSQLELQMRPNCRLLEKIMMIPRHSLPFFGTPQGFFAFGKNIKLDVDGQSIGPVNKLFEMTFGPYSVSQLGQFKTNANMILFVESHAELSNLIQEKVLDKAENTIFLTSCGSADLGFCMVLSKLASECNIPVRFLVDSDIGGMLIAANLAFGRFSSEFKDRDSLLTPFMQPLGILPRDFLPSDLFMSDLTASEQKGIQTLKNKWESHGIALVRDQKFWMEIVTGFQGNGKKMSLAEMRLNRSPDFILNKIVKAEKSADRDEIRQMIETTTLDIPMNRESRNDPIYK